MRKHTCAAWIPALSEECGEVARFYTCGPRCDPHSPAALAGRPVATPDPQQTAQAFRGRSRQRPDPLKNLPDDCDHGESRGPRFCALCRRHARNGNP